MTEPKRDTSACRSGSALEPEPDPPLSAPTTVGPLAWMPVLGRPLAIPAALLDARQAMENHGQTLERLAERGGLSLDEAAAVVERRRWRKTTADEALAALKNACTQRGVRVAQRLNPPEHDMSRRQEPRYAL